MDERELNLLDQFIVSTIETLGIRHLTLLLIKTKAAQKAELSAWLASKKTANQTTITNLDAAKTVTETNLTTENTSIDSLITKL